MTLLSLSRPSITDEEIRAAERALRSRWLVYGPENRAFEEELAAACGKRFCIAVSSGTAALHLALLALPERPTALLVPSFTFPATANVASFVASPPEIHLADVNEKTFCVEKDTLSAWFAARKGTAVVVHPFGYPAQVPEAHTDAVISDAACAVMVPQAMVGKVACLSFHPRKLLTTGEGGAILTDDETLCETLRRLRSHGLFTRPTPSGETPAEVMEMEAPGLNYRLSEPQAAIGRVQLRRLRELTEKHRELVGRYRQMLADVSVGLQDDHPDRIWQTMVVVLPDTVSRKAVRERLKTEGIETQIASYALHRLAFYRGAARFPNQGANTTLSVSDMLHDRAVALPLHSELSVSDVERVCACLRHALSMSDVRRAGKIG